MGMVAAIFGLAGVYASARLYQVAARPAWNSTHTLLEFGLSGALTGTLAASLFLPQARAVLALAAGWSAMVLAVQQLARIVHMCASPELERRISGKLLCFRLRSTVLMRHLGLWAMALAMLTQQVKLWQLGCCFVFAIGVELLGRWLFFVSVVPKNMAAPYLGERRAA